jgi:ABC-type nickel/cobalt efflux system permease component RcnA
MMIATLTTSTVITLVASIVTVTIAVVILYKYAFTYLPRSISIDEARHVESIGRT